MDVTWSVPGEDITGQGQIINISASGIFLQIDNSFKSLEKCVLSIDADVMIDKPPFVSKKGKVVSFRKSPSSHYRYQCGVDFLKDNQSNESLAEWMEHKTTQLAGTMNASILHNYVV